MAHRILFALICVCLTVPLSGCMGPVRAAGGLVQSVASTGVTAAKAGGIMLKDAATIPYNAAKGAWNQASIGQAPELEPPEGPP